MERRLKEKLPGGIFHDVSSTRSRTMAAIRGKHAASTERRLRMVLIRSKISGWKLHAADFPGKPDFFFPNHKLAVFVDGCFWHGCPKCGHVPKTNTPFWSAKITRNIERDRLNRAALKKLGIRVFRVWEHALKSPASINTIIKKIKLEINARPI